MIAVVLPVDKFTSPVSALRAGIDVGVNIVAVVELPITFGRSRAHMQVSHVVETRERPKNAIPIILQKCH